MSRKPRDYSNTPLYSARLNRVKDADIVNWLERAIAADKGAGGSGFSDVLRTLVEDAQAGPRRKTLAPEKRMERLVLHLLNEKMAEIEDLILTRPVMVMSGGDQQHGHSHFTAEDVSGLIDDSDLRSLMDELEGEFD